MIVFLLFVVLHFFLQADPCNIVLKVEAEKHILRNPHSCGHELCSLAKLFNTHLSLRCELKSLLWSGATSQYPMSLRRERSSKIWMFGFRSRTLILWKCHGSGCWRMFSSCIVRNCLGGRSAEGVLHLNCGMVQKLSQAKPNQAFLPGLAFIWFNSLNHLGLFPEPGHRISEVGACSMHQEEIVPH